MTWSFVGSIQKFDYTGVNEYSSEIHVQIDKTPMGVQIIELLGMKLNGLDKEKEKKT
jgi:hypothetical protein